MRLFNAILFLNLLWVSAALATAPQAKDLNGTWQYYKKVYRNQDYIEPESTLRLFISFYADGTERLFWYYEGESIWCERRGVFTLQEDNLEETVTWISPQNSRECGRDPDMQWGTKNTPISIGENGDLNIHLFLDVEPLLVVWKKMGE